jgi:Cu/Ag efflux protein CusF
MKISTFLLVPSLAASALAQAQMSAEMKMPMPTKGAASAASSSSALTEGVVQSVDPVKGVVTLKHGDIVNMKMPAMTMAFGVADKSMLNNVKTGDKVKFHVELLKNAPTVTHIEPSR